MTDHPKGNGRAWTSDSKRFYTGRVGFVVDLDTPDRRRSNAAPPAAARPPIARVFAFIFRLLSSLARLPARQRLGSAGASCS